MDPFLVRVAHRLLPSSCSFKRIFLKEIDFSVKSKKYKAEEKAAQHLPPKSEMDSNTRDAAKLGHIWLYSVTFTTFVYLVT